MAQQLINIGTLPNDRTGDTWRDAMDKANQNFTELYSGDPINTLVINQESDFPTQDGTTITLEDGVRYYMGNLVTTAKRFIVQPQAVISGPSLATLSLVYTGTGNMFTSTAGFVMYNLNFSCPNGTAFAATGSTGDFLVANQSSCTECLNVGSFDVTGIFGTAFSFPLVTGQGFKITGASQGVLLDAFNLVGSSSSMVGIDLDAATTALFRIVNSTIAGVPGGVALSGLVNSGNIIPSFRGTVDTCNFGIGVTPLVNIDPTDARWNFQDVIGVRDSRNDIDLFLDGGLETIVVASAGDWYEIGTPSGGGVFWDSTLQSRFSFGADGVITYDGEVDIDIRVSGRATVEKVGGGSDEIECRIAINWTGVVSDGGLPRSRAGTQNSTPTSVPVGALVSISPGDNIRMIFSNQTGSSNILAEVSSLEVTGL